MADYKCKDCTNNKNGWCPIKKMNGLKAKNIQECDSFQSEKRKDVHIYRSSKDAYGQQHITIKINQEEVNFPEVILREFLDNKTSQGIEFSINMKD